MNTHAEKKQEHRRQSVANSNSPKRAAGVATFQFADNRRESIEQKTLEEMANNSPRAMQLKAFRDMTTNSPVQRFPMPLDEQNNEVYTDSKHSWLRMIFREDLGDHTFELLKLDGNQSGSYMIFEREYDQYRFSSDGREVNERFKPHFMEEITGDARISDEEELYSYVGEYGVGYRPARRVSAELELSGLISCIGFVLESESAGFVCHMVVTDGTPKDQDVLKRQVNALVAKFTQHAGEKPELCQLLYDESTYRGRPRWLSWMEPDGVRTSVEPVSGDFRRIIRGRMEGEPTVMWRGNPIRY